MKLYVKICVFSPMHSGRSQTSPVQLAKQLHLLYPTHKPCDEQLLLLVQSCKLHADPVQPRSQLHTSGATHDPCSLQLLTWKTTVIAYTSIKYQVHRPH